jgi:hypothetical protein
MRSLFCNDLLTESPRHVPTVEMEVRGGLQRCASDQARDRAFTANNF